MHACGIDSPDWNGVQPLHVLHEPRHLLGLLVDANQQDLLDVIQLGAGLYVVLDQGDTSNGEQGLGDIQ